MAKFSSFPQFFRNYSESKTKQVRKTCGKILVKFAIEKIYSEAPTYR